MCYWRSQVPTTLVPINQPKKSQSYGEEYSKRIAVGLATIVYMIINECLESCVSNTNFYLISK